MTRVEAPRELIREILEGDDDDRRFEKFTADLFTQRDGFHYETTARTGDQGVDARARVRLANGAAVVCATTQSSGFKSKGKADIDKQIAQARRIARLHVCFSKDVKNETLEEIRQYAEEKLPLAEIEVHGLSGLTDLAFRYQQPFLDNYSRDLDEQALWCRVKADDEDRDTNQINLLRVAITTVFHEEMVRQRELIMDTLVITALSDGKPRSLKELSSDVGEGLKLTQPPVTSSLVSAVGSLKARGFVREVRNGFGLTDTGYELRDRLIAQGMRSAIDGRSAFKSLLGNLPTALLSADDFSRLWKAVQRRLSHAFLKNGLRVIAELQSIAHNTTVDSNPATELGILSNTVQNILADVQAMRLQAGAAQKVAAVLGEMLCNRQSEAFRWISELGVKYVIICSLGLDPEVERRIRDRISNWVVIPDTHVILAYLCAGDEGHIGANAVLKQLQRLNCPIWAMEPVLEEAVYHAEIAGDSYRDWYERVRLVQKEFPKADPASLLHTSDNAFVKGFACETQGNIGYPTWLEYIRQFVGHGRQKVLPLAEILEHELSARFIADDDRVRQVGFAFVQRLLRPDEKEVNPAITLRCERDGRLLASTLVLREKEPPGRRIIIMSDSDRLRSSFYSTTTADKRHGVKISEPAAIACALAVVPGTSVNLECVRHFLFSGGVTFSELERPDMLLAEAFLNTPKLLRHAALNDRLDDAIAMLRGSGAKPA